MEAQVQNFSFSVRNILDGNAVHVNAKHPHKLWSTLSQLFKDNGYAIRLAIVQARCHVTLKFIGKIIVSHSRYLQAMSIFSYKVSIFLKNVQNYDITCTNSVYLTHHNIFIIN